MCPAFKKRAHPLARRDPFPVLDRGEELDGSLRVSGGVQGERGLVLAEALSIRVGGVFFLHLGRVHEQKLGEVERRGDAIDGTAEPVLSQSRQIAGVIDVGVREKNEVERVWLESGPLPVHRPEIFQSLEHARVDEEAATLCLDEEARARHRARLAVKRKLLAHEAR
jgi:hypothetical protein